jgi:hypothetical protein
MNWQGCWKMFISRLTMNVALPFHLWRQDSSLIVICITEELVQEVQRAWHPRSYPSLLNYFLLGQICFYQWTFPCSKPHIHAGWWPSHTNLLLFWLLSKDSPVMAAGPGLMDIHLGEDSTSEDLKLLVISLLSCLLPSFPVERCLFFLHGIHFSQQVCQYSLHLHIVAI